MDDYLTFNVYSLHNMHEEPDDDNAVELGLSRGELCQSLLDRIRECVNEEYVELLNTNLEPFGFHINPSMMKTKSKRDQVLRDIEDVLYECDEEELLDSYWSFPEELIYIGEAVE